MARIVRLIHDRLITIRNAPYTLYGMARGEFDGGQHGLIFTFIFGNGPASWPVFGGRQYTPYRPPLDELADVFDYYVFDFLWGR